MKTVWKYTLGAKEEQTIRVPKDAVPLSVGMQGGNLCLWMLVESDWPKEDRKVLVKGTGHPIEFAFEQFEFVGTVVMPIGLVRHVWVDVTEG